MGMFLLSPLPSLCDHRKPHLPSPHLPSIHPSISAESKLTQTLQVFAEVVASLSVFTSLLYMIPFLLKIPFLFLWDTILFILWISLFGLFGNMYIKEKAEGDAGVQRMKNAVWVDLVNALLWLGSAIGMGVWWFRGDRRSRFTGRAVV